MQALSSLPPLLKSLLSGGISTGSAPLADRSPVRNLQKQHRMLEEEVVQMLADYVAGQSVAQVSKAYGLHRTIVLEHLEKNGVDRRRHVRKLTNDEVQQASVLYATGISLVHVAEQFDVNEATIRREFTKAGVTVRPRRGWDSRGKV